MNFKAFIFDFDGTLIDSAPDLANGINLMRNFYHLAPLPKQTVISYVGDGAIQLVDRSLQDSPINRQEALNIFLDFYKKNICCETTLYPGVIEFLEELKKRKIPSAILTNKPQDLTDILLEKLNIAHFFVFAYGPEKFGKKPDPAGLIEALKLFNLKPHEVLMIGDHHTDIFAANRANIPSVFLTYGYGIIGESKPTYIIDRFEDLTNFL